MGVVNILKLRNFILSFHKTKSHSTDQISGNFELDNLNSSFKPSNILSCHLAGSGGKKNGHSILVLLLSIMLCWASVQTAPPSFLCNPFTLSKVTSLENVLHLEFHYRDTWERAANTSFRGRNCIFILKPANSRSLAKLSVLIEVVM